MTKLLCDKVVSDKEDAEEEEEEEEGHAGGGGGADLKTRPTHNFVGNKKYLKNKPTHDMTLITHPNVFPKNQPTCGVP